MVSPSLLPSPHHHGRLLCTRAALLAHISRWALLRDSSPVSSNSAVLPGLGQGDPTLVLWACLCPTRHGLLPRRLTSHQPAGHDPSPTRRSSVWRPCLSFHFWPQPHPRCWEMCSWVWAPQPPPPSSVYIHSATPADQGCTGAEWAQGTGKRWQGHLGQSLPGLEGPGCGL